MKKIKVITLLNKIANGEEVPEKIKYNNIEYNLNEITGWYQSIDVIGQVNEWFISKHRLNDEVEIIEEPEIDIQGIEELKIFSDATVYDYNDVDRNRKVINELIKAVKQLDNQINNK